MSPSLFRVLVASGFALPILAATSLAASQYSGNIGTRDPCARLLKTLYNFGPLVNDSTLGACDDCFCAYCERPRRRGGGL